MLNYRSALDAPSTDPTPLVEFFRGAYGTELLTAAVAHLRVFELLGEGPLSFDELRRRLDLAERPANVLFTALLAMGVLEHIDAPNGTDRKLLPKTRLLQLSELAREHLLPDQPFYIGDYFTLAAESPGVVEMVNRLRTNRPASAKQEEGTAYIYREGLDSAMESEPSARRLTLALAGRAKNVAPALARNVLLEDSRLLLDVGGGTGIYSIALLQANPTLHAIVWDRPEVLRVAAEMAAEYGVTDRLHCIPGDMFTDPMPGTESLPATINKQQSANGPDIVLLSNVLHDWDVPDCRKLVRRCADRLAPGGRLIIHDVFLNDALDGPLPIAFYSAALFTLTEGRAYSALEYRDWLLEAGLVPIEERPTLIHCGAIVAQKANT